MSTHDAGPVRAWQTRPRSTRLLWLSRATFAGLAVGFGGAALLGVRLSLATQSALYLLLMIGVSLPHGGVEHVLNLAGRDRPFQWRYLLAYLLLLAGSLALFHVSPVGGLLLALAVTVLKAGHGGLAVLSATSGTDHLRSPPQRALATGVRGGAVMVVPALFHTGVFQMVSSYMTELFAADAADLGWLFADGVLLAAGGLYAAALLTHLALGYRRRTDGRAWRVEAAETCLLVGYFAVVPPILAVGVYFPLWYAARQVARATTDSDLAALLPSASRLRAVGVAALPWLGALALFGASYYAVPNPPTGVFGWVALYSVFVAVVAVPHVVVGAWLDRRQGIWAV